MPASYLDVVQDAIKIGFPVVGTVFGAMIGAIGTYFVTKLRHANEIEKDVLDRRMTLVEEIAEDFALIADVVGKHWAESKLEHTCRIQNVPTPELVKNNLERIAQMLHDAQPKLKRIESRLLVLGIDDAYETLLAYMKEVERFRRDVAIDAPPLPQGGFDGYSESLGKHEIAFYKKLRGKYTGA